MKKRTGINYGRKYAAITLAAVTAACTGATAGSAVTVAAAEENKTLVYWYPCQRYSSLQSPSE